MQFDIKGASKVDPFIINFREEWLEATRKENIYISGDAKYGNRISDAQRFFIEIFTGIQPEDMETGQGWPLHKVEGYFHFQAELEALFRARSIALAKVFRNHAEQ